MELTVTKCGKCAGCQSEQAMQRCIALMDDIIAPKIAKAGRAIESAHDHRDPLFVDAHRRYQSLHDYRLRHIQWLVKQFGYPGCYAMTVEAA